MHAHVFVRTYRQAFMRAYITHSNFFFNLFVKAILYSLLPPILEYHSQIVADYRKIKKLAANKPSRTQMWFHLERAMSGIECHYNYTHYSRLWLSVYASAMFAIRDRFLVPTEKVPTWVEVIQFLDPKSHKLYFFGLECT